MDISIKAPRRIDVSLRMPASKSVSHRALVACALCTGCPWPSQLSDCDDTQTLLRALQAKPGVVDVGASGTALRFLTAYCAVTPGVWRLQGTPRLHQRPMGELVAALRQLGADIRELGEAGCAPLQVVGRPLQGGVVSLRADVSSQFVSALLLVAPVLPKGLRLELSGYMVSVPYIELTLQVMRHYGADAQWVGPGVIEVKPRPYRAARLEVEGDWTAASYWLEMECLHPDAHIQLDGLCPDSMQGDRVVTRLFGQMMHDEVFRFDFAQHPDLVPTMAVCSALKGKPFVFMGVRNLRVKECDRLMALQAELRKWGYVLACTDDTLCWDGTRCNPTDQPIDTHHDHRMAMAFAAAAAARGQVSIRHAEVVSKSYPAFWNHLRLAGFTLTIT